MKRTLLIRLGGLAVMEGDCPQESRLDYLAYRPSFSRTLRLASIVAASTAERAFSSLSLSLS
jgi:hypothetical protein